MARYYAIYLTSSATNQPPKDSLGKAIGPFLTTSDGTPTGQPLPGALNIELDLPLTSFDQLSNPGILNIWGLPLQTLTQASQLNPAPDFSTYTSIQVYGGMSKGLPLANPAQAKLLVSGTVYNCFGNWQGTQQVMTFVIQTLGLPTVNAGSQAAPVNISFVWAQGQLLGDAVSRALKAAFPKAVINDYTSKSLVSVYDTQSGTYPTLAAFAEYVSNVSLALNGAANYLGVKIVPTTGGFNLVDMSTSLTPGIVVPIAFTDLIGQPVWLDVATVQFKAVMRGDLQVGQLISMPKGPQIVSAQSSSQFRNRAIFQGNLGITAIRHLGNFRQRSPDSWVTIVTAVQQ